jgi:nucleoside-diphosphate-sugar epimerase
MRLDNILYAQSTVRNFRHLDEELTRLPRSLVTGGAGYFGELLARRLLASGQEVRVLDLNRSDLPGIEQVTGDIRDPAKVAQACHGIDVVYHNVAQVPLAKDSRLFSSVNEDGTRILLEESRKAGIQKVVCTSSSAVFGVPDKNPVTRATPPKPAETYGRAKLAGEKLCRKAVGVGLDVSIVRPRTILGHGRLGIVQILFDWISTGRDVPVFNGGNNIYQFVHADDLAWACIAAGRRPGFAIYNIGAEHFGTMRELLDALIRHAKSASRIKSLPMAPMEIVMSVASRLGLSPLGPYHALMYGRELYFDVSDAQRELGYAPHYSNEMAICQSYDWYIANRNSISFEGPSHHKSAVRKGILALTPALLKVLPS